MRRRSRTIATVDDDMVLCFPLVVVVGFVDRTCRGGYDRWRDGTVVGNFGFLACWFGTDDTSAAVVNIAVAVGCDCDRHGFVDVVAAAVVEVDCVVISGSRANAQHGTCTARRIIIATAFSDRVTVRIVGEGLNRFQLTRPSFERGR